jgi:hypothetical protein
MNNAGDNTHKPRAVDPRVFRAAATGVGQSLGASALTGDRRAQQAINAAPAAQRAVADPSYPAPNQTTEGDWMPTGNGGEVAIRNGRPVLVTPPDGCTLASPVQLKRAGR